MMFNTWGAITGAMLAGVMFLVWPDKPALTVYDISWNGLEIEADRQVNEPPYDADYFIMDWEVVVFDKDRTGPPTCRTETGANENEGWSRYVPGPRGKLSFPIDVWVGDDGCEARLTRGIGYTMKVVWTPDDGRRPVSAFTEFTY